MRNIAAISPILVATTCLLFSGSAQAQAVSLEIDQSKPLQLLSAMRALLMLLSTIPKHSLSSANRPAARTFWQLISAAGQCFLAKSRFVQLELTT
jgi:hypothetical protein